MRVSEVPQPRRDRLVMECGTLTVPLDHADPSRGTLDVAVGRIRVIDQRQRIGSLVLNPGGPGVSGVDFMPSWAAWFPDELLDRFELVSFDPRGTGRSGPIRCLIPNKQGLPDLLTDAGWSEATALIRARTQSCEASLGATAGLYSTDATARDVELLRAALGDAALTYVGWSYGARLGAQYARLFPDRVRALVLDAPPAPTAPSPSVIATQLAGFEARFASYADQCAARATCEEIGDARGLLNRVVARARTTPIRSGRPVGDPPATWDLVLRAVLGFMTASELWPLLDAALSEAWDGDSGSLYEMLDTQRGAEDAATVIQCNDSAPGSPPEQLRSDAATLARDHPTFGEYGAWWLFGCAYWTAPHQALPTTALTGSAPVLVVGTRADPSTPYPGALAFTETLGPNATLLTWDGGGHTAFGRSPCVGTHVTAYLLELRIPDRGTVCPRGDG